MYHRLGDIIALLITISQSVTVLHGSVEMQSLIGPIIFWFLILAPFGLLTDAMEERVRLWVSQANARPPWPYIHHLDLMNSQHNVPVIMFHMLSATYCRPDKINAHMKNAVSALVFRKNYRLRMIMLLCVLYYIFSWNVFPCFLSFPPYKASLWPVSSSGIEKHFHCGMFDLCPNG